MATKVEDVYNNIVDVIETALPSIVRFPNPYQMSTNALGRTIVAYGLVVGPGVNTQRYVGCLVSWQRTYTIRLLRKITSTEGDLAKREIIEQEILNDSDILLKAFWNNTTLESKAIKATIVDDSGLDFIDGDTLKFLQMDITLEVEYQDSPT